MNDLPLFEFGGKSFDAKRDGARLGAQMQAVRALMSDGAWRTLAEISAATGAPQASVSARLRDIRNKDGMDLQRQRVEGGNGLHRYRVWHL